jgi:hypothetical protein
MSKGPRKEIGIADVVITMCVIGICTLGGWGVWVTKASYDANEHVRQSEDINNKLETTVDRLIEVEKSFISIQAEVSSSTGINRILLNQILEQVAP